MRLREQEQKRATEEVLECPSLQQTIAPANLLAFADLSNVIFLRRQQPAQVDAPPCIVNADTRPAPLPPRLLSTRFATALVATIALHGAALAAFIYQPTPLPSLGVEAISIELVIGTETLAGQQQSPSPQEADSAPAKAEEKPIDKVVENADPDDAKVADKPMELAAVQPTPDETKVEAQPQAVEPPKPEEAKPVETKIEPTVEPIYTKPPVEKPTPKPAKPAEPKHAKKKADRDTDRTRQRVAAVTPQAASVSSNGAGIGQSSRDADYRNLVRGHLMRFKPASESGGGTSNIRFSFNSSGAVTSVTLVSGSGNPRNDEMAVAMARRASPFPKPPDGRPQTFPIPIIWAR